MLNGVKKSIFCFLIAITTCAFAFEGGEVLWWTIGTDYKSLTGTASDGTVYTAGELGVTDVRLRYESTDGSSGYLTLLGVNDDSSVTVYDGSTGMGAEHGMGLPANYYASLTGLTGSSYSFVLELGNYANGQWVRTSMEASASYDTLLASNHISVWDKQDHSYGKPWSPTSYVVLVPEPTSGLLFVIGGALLALRRKRKGV